MTDYVIPKELLDKTLDTMKMVERKLHQYDNLIHDAFYIDEDGEVKYAFPNPVDAYEAKELIKKILNGEPF